MPAKPPTAEEYDRLARDWVRAFDARDEAALRRLNDHYGRPFTFDDLSAEIWRRVYAFRQRSSKVEKNYLQLSEAQLLLAQDAGFGSWPALLAAATSGAPPLPLFLVDPDANRIAPCRQLTDADWDQLLTAMSERGITRLDANGLMTDTVLARVAQLPHVTALVLGGSRQLTDAGLRTLARMPQLEILGLSEYPGGKLSDRGLAVLEQLPNLRRFEMAWQGGITDAGVRHLAACDLLEEVDLMGSPTGDGAIEALQGKARLARFKSGKLVTDRGLRLLRGLPRLATWAGEPGDEGAHLLIDGPFSDEGLAAVAALDGVCDLDLFWHVTGITPDAFAPLARLPHLVSLGADGDLASDGAMRHIAAFPGLKNLRVQGTVATDEGFEALSRSQTIEQIWGRECPNLGSRGFLALSRMPALRALAVSCRNVDDAALAALPQFPALADLTPIDVTDDGFRHVGRCERLQRLSCMYCRDTTDAATERIAGLRLRYYYAGLTQITDRSLEILGRMETLEEIDLYECQGVTDAGLAFLARLPRLGKIGLSGLPQVTHAGTGVFPPAVRVRYSP